MNGDQICWSWWCAFWCNVGWCNERSNEEPEQETRNKIDSTALRKGVRLRVSGRDIQIRPARRRFVRIHFLHREVRGVITAAITQVAANKLKIEIDAKCDLGSSHCYPTLRPITRRRCPTSNQSGRYPRKKAAAEHRHAPDEYVYSAIVAPMLTVPHVLGSGRFKPAL